MGSAGPTDFGRYYAATAERPPRRTLLAALARFAAPGFAVDLGCGSGRDTVALLQGGWSVLAIDAEPDALALLASRVPAEAPLATLCARIEDAAWPPADLVNASFILPLVPPDRFPALWQRVVASLRPGGRFAGQFYGERDGWAGEPGVTHHGRGEALALFAGFAIELFDEEESDAVTPGGKAKHWHVFHAVAVRR
jgi:tellurite methyltransferase